MLIAVLRLHYHHSNAIFLYPSALLLLSYVRVTAGFSTLTRPASLQEWQNVCLDCGVAPHSLNICSSALPAPRQNWQLKTYGTIQTRWLIFWSSTTTDERGELWATTTTTTTTGLVGYITEIVCCLNQDRCKATMQVYVNHDQLVNHSLYPMHVTTPRSSTLPSLNCRDSAGGEDTLKSVTECDVNSASPIWSNHRHWLTRRIECWCRRQVVLPHVASQNSTVIAGQQWARPTSMASLRTIERGEVVTIVNTPVGYGRHVPRARKTNYCSTALEYSARQLPSLVLLLLLMLLLLYRSSCSVWLPTRVDSWRTATDSASSHHRISLRCIYNTCIASVFCT